MSQPTTRQYSLPDRLLASADQALRTLVPGAAAASRPSPAQQREQHEMTDAERQHAAALMRINHTGEVCAQALYQGQALTAKLADVREAMETAAAEEIDHLAWCEARIRELDGHTSLLNPLFYGLSLGIGAAAGKIGDKVSLGFVAATEQQVCKHLTSHLSALPVQDERSKAVLLQMLEDEARHATTALEAGGHKFPLPIKMAMSAVSRVMTGATYRI
ncbi:MULTISPECIES: 2-polyprenyl-3-methyl-6-methoxy-1,4-benzoquinone monooxygenase [unclassified Oceanobacter]|uniref:2-polyprenyl-3-methyl-6-methoxy-1,4-benzoquinone monooxygenase n=1 Tax=unclassified Oceanobacter TaxID=2620260 RepID=UPI002734EF90|nr:MULTISPECIES: 2-polyprenyl-3-methyl-6-methoxy-1,4-benzoquinone monooxygenase [unclassified Oceanobacter]MDP2505006.1 2-polyprenyl-3-methyl-6-methoxy-1,4-benzoquinone monooxygenase [Oceanobacter sp. 3_MG-2023]MDP2548565.1 2-polyprenyl-3-methyl-6-methoxy-1,4-benzoquinone monooxygenase [Oceanobacter sp. 4_MG-2023]